VYLYETSNYLLISEFQLRELRIMINYVSYRHGGTQKLIVNNNNGSDALKIPLDLAGCMIDFRHDCLLMKKF
jgi:hypothetical protein